MPFYGSKSPRLEFRETAQGELIEGTGNRDFVFNFTQFFQQDAKQSYNESSQVNDEQMRRRHRWV
jgi:hypothetical protein